MSVLPKLGGAKQDLPYPTLTWTLYNPNPLERTLVFVEHYVGSHACFVDVMAGLLLRYSNSVTRIGKPSYLL